MVLLDTTLLAETLVRYKSTADRPEELADCLDFCRDYLSEEGIRTRIINRHGKPSLLANMKGYSTGLLLTGHVDVVSGKESQFHPKRVKNKIMGRGAADMKAGCAIALNVMRRLSAENANDDVGLVLTSDEEIGGDEGIGHLVEKGLHADFAVAMEPRQKGITVEHKGMIWAKLHAKGISGHASRPWETQNAAVKLMKGVEEALALTPNSTHEEWSDTASLTILSSGKVPNQVPDEAEAVIDYRTITEEAQERIIRELGKIPDIHVEILKRAPMLTMAKDHSNINALRRIAQQRIGKTIPLIHGHGSSDMRWLSAKGIPCVEFGPNGNGHHGGEEWVSIPDMKKLEETYMEFARRF